MLEANTLERGRNSTGYIVWPVRVLCRNGQNIINLKSHIEKKHFKQKPSQITFITMEKTPFFNANMQYYLNTQRGWA
jgi:hypothetical protein